MALACCRSPAPRLLDSSALMPTPVPTLIATISICTGNASVRAFTARSPIFLICSVSGMQLTK